MSAETKVVDKSETKEHEVLIDLVLKGFNFEPEQLQDFISLIPTATKSSEKSAPKWNYWQYGVVKKSDFVDAYDLSERLVQQLLPEKQGIIEAIKKFKLNPMFRVVIYLSTSNQIPMPAIGFSRDVISFIDSIGATIDIDTYR